jgi:tetratricopeptide (TPR) repeat protein
VREAARGVAKDTALVESSLERRLARARREELDGRLLEAQRDYASIARDFRGLRDVSETQERLSRLKKEKRFGELVAAEEKRRKAERAAIDRLSARLDSIRTAEEPPALPRLLSDLEIAGWKKRAASADREEALSSRRVLEWLFVRASLFLPEELLARKDLSRAVLSLSVATEIKPESPQAWYNLACAQARAGRRKEAFEDLRAAIGRGFRDRTLLESDSDLESLRGDEEFRRIIDLVR